MSAQSSTQRKVLPIQDQPRAGPGSSGFPTAEAAKQALDETAFSRAVQA